MNNRTIAAAALAALAIGCTDLDVTNPNEPDRERVLTNPLDVQALDCDFYCFSSHKMFGPTGVGLVLTGRLVLGSTCAEPPFNAV